MSRYKESKYHDTSNFKTEPTHNENTSIILTHTKQPKLAHCNRKVELFSHYAIKRSWQANIHAQLRGLKTLQTGARLQNIKHFAI